MKPLKTLLALLFVLFVQHVFAQTETHLRLSDACPAVGEKITLMYDPAGTVTEGKKDINAVVYYFDNKNYPASDIDLKPDGKLLKGEILIPENIKAFFIKISSNELVDNNNGKGYVYMVYKDKQPVEGAYAVNANIISRGLGNYLAKIKNDNNKAIALYQKENVAYPKSEKEYQDNYYTLLAKSRESKPAVINKIHSLEKETGEKDLILAAKLLRALNNIKGADSLNTIINIKFPNGELAKSALITSFYQEKDLSKKELMFNVFTKQYPDNGIDENSIQDNLRLQLAAAYLKKRDMSNYKKYETGLKNKSNLAGVYNNVGWDWAVANEHLDEAEKLVKQAVDIAIEKMDAPVASPYTSPKQAKINDQHSYDSYADTYAYILLKENKGPEALKYMQGVYDHTKSETNSSEHYILILAANGQYEKALEVTATSIKQGQNSTVLKEELKKNYFKVKGNNNGYDAYLTALENESKIFANAELAKTMINMPAPEFSLKDIDGIKVSLKDLKGKVVIVDFWATWCGPCKASFPGMQMTVNKYKNDANVKFLFVDTWENGDNYLAGVKRFIADNNYTFHVLIDEKNADGRQAKVVSAFEVTGIPTKFIIDKSGNIRFKYVGYSGTPEKVVDEVSAMVDMAGSPDAIIAKQK